MILECDTLRVGGHYEGDPQRGRDPADREKAAARDPVTIARRFLTEDVIARINAEVAAEIAAAIAFARAAPEPGWADAAASVYAAQS